MDSRTFDDGLLKAYRGERAAVVMLRCLQEQVLSDEERVLAELFIAVETLVGDRLEPLVRRRGLPVSLDGETIEKAEMRALAMTGWRDVIASLGEPLEGYLAEFEALRAAAPPAEREAFDFLVEHEAALIRFGVLLREGKAEDARSALLSLLPSDVRSNEKAVQAKLEAPPGAA